MESLITFLLLLCAESYALIARADACACSFSLTASGGTSGVIAQLPDGQNRIGSTGLPAASYCLGSNGGITDGQGRGCILTEPTTQFQCDSGANPTPGFSIGCDGTVYYDGSSQFYACQTGSNGENIYTSITGSETGCVSITLHASGCYTPCAPPPAASCGSLGQNYEYPHLITPVSSANPDTAYGTSYAGEVTDEIASIFNFDIPTSDAGKTCTLAFFFPTQAELQTSSFTFSGDGKVYFTSLSKPATSSTTYDNMKQLGITASTMGTLAPGSDFQVAQFACPAGGTYTVAMFQAGSTDFSWFQDYNPCP